MGCGFVAGMGMGMVLLLVIVLLVAIALIAFILTGGLNVNIGFGA
jgi:hypothetical protein